VKLPETDIFGPLYFGRGPSNFWPSF